jgi:ferritin-like metal-binding protein YciE
MKTLADAFEHTLQDVYFAENAIAKALPKVIEAVSNGDLKTALKDHLSETKGQIKTLEAVFKSIGKKVSGEKCDAIEGLIKETEGVIEEAEGAVASSLVAPHSALQVGGSMVSWKRPAKRSARSTRR